MAREDVLMEPGGVAGFCIAAAIILGTIAVLLWGE